MLVLLPPSEGKAMPPARSNALDFESLSFPDLNATREQLARTLVAVSAGPERRALDALGLTANQTDELARNRALMEAPTRRVDATYTGVLYDALDLATLNATARRRAVRTVVVSSALFGALRLSDRIPAYRLSMAARLPRLGTLASVWKDPLGSAMANVAKGHLVVDLRSGSYAAAWKPHGAIAESTAGVRVLHESRPGDPSSRSVVSHFNKATKGRILRALLASAANPRTVEELVEVLSHLDYTVELGDVRPHRVRTLDVVVAAV